MTKKEIVKAISEEIGLTQLQTKQVVQKTFDAIVETLVEEGRIELRNFGVFEVKKRAARRARNPRTGERVSVEEKYVVTFKPGKHMEQRVRALAKARRGEAHPVETGDPPSGASSPQAPSYGVFDGGENTEISQVANPAPPSPSPDSGPSAIEGYGRAGGYGGA